MKRWVLSIAQRLADIRNTRLWAWIGPAYRGSVRVFSLESCLPRALRAVLGRGLHRLLFDIPQPRDRKLPPRPDLEVLRREYRERGLDRQADTFVLYRIIGNDLVPRHRKGQSRDNVAWILENEPALAGCEKRWVLNRIVDPEEEAIIIHLLEAHGQPYLRIQFEWDAYAARPWDLEGMPWAGFTLSEAFGDLRKDIRQRAIKRLYRHKNNYAINNNGARNAALEDGRGRAKWVLPWDGNCFITASAWKEIVAGVKVAPWNKYFIVPMARIIDNLRLLDAGFHPEAREEPQVLFRRDAGERFDESYYYGRRPKIELFWRLGIPGKWDRCVIEPWDLPCPDYSPEVGQWARAGWVARLSSGSPALETGRQSEDQRCRARVEAVTAMLDRLDEVAHGPLMRPDRPVFSSACRSGLGISEGAGMETERDLLLRLDRAAEEALTDGSRSLLDDTFILSLAFVKLGDARYADHAAHVVRRSFLDRDTSLSPWSRVWWQRIGKPGRIIEVFGTRDFYYFLDAVRLLRATGVLSGDDQERLRAWFRTYLQWLLVSPEGRRDRARADHRGVYYDLQVAAIAGFLGDYLLLRDTLRDSRVRILQQFDSDGKPLEELKRTNTAHHCCRNLQGWIHVADQAEACGEDLWSFEGSRGQGLRKAIEWMLRHMGQEWPYRQDDAFDHERFYPIYYAYRARYPRARVAREMPPPADIKPLFYPHDGVRPFWQLNIVTASSD